MSEDEEAMLLKKEEYSIKRQVSKLASKSHQKWDLLTGEVLTEIYCTVDGTGLKHYLRQLRRRLFEQFFRPRRLRTAIPERHGYIREQHYIVFATSLLVHQRSTLRDFMRQRFRGSRRRKNRQEEKLDKFGHRILHRKSHHCFVNFILDDYNRENRDRNRLRPAVLDVDGIFDRGHEHGLSQRGHQLRHDLAESGHDIHVRS